MTPINATKFIAYCPSGDMPYHTYSLFITDIEYWMAAETEIFDWLSAHIINGKDCQRGMVLVFSSGEELIAFLLRWG